MFVGVDAGGTITALVLIDREGNCIALESSEARPEVL